MSEQEPNFQPSAAEAIQPPDPELDAYQLFMDTLPSGRSFVVHAQLTLHCADARQLRTTTSILAGTVGGMTEVGDTTIRIERQPKPRPAPPSKAPVCNREHAGTLSSKLDANTVRIAELLNEQLTPDAKFVHYQLGKLLLQTNVQWPESEKLDALTLRETEVLELVAQGMSNPQIGTHLGVASSTVKSCIQHISQKLEVPGDRTYLAMAYFRHLLLQSLGGIEAPEE